MKIKINNRITEKIKSVSLIRNLSGTLNMALTGPMASGREIYPDDVNKLREDAIKLKEMMAKADDDHLELDKAMLMVIILDLLKPVMRGEEMWADIMGAVEDEAVIFDAGEYAENPYYKNIKFDDKVSGDYKLTHSSYRPYEIFVYDCPVRYGDTLIDIPRIGCFDKSFVFPSITEKGDAWMSVTPNEVMTMKNQIAEAHGRVLTLGLGMGYYTYMASLKDDVESVTVIEREQSVIDLFDTYILPQFEHKEKIHIIKADAVEYMKNLTDGEYDYCFADIWQGLDDMDTYFAVKEVSRRRFTHMKMSYWIENSYIYALLSSVCLDILFTFYETSGIPAPSLDKMRDSERRQLEYIKKLLDGEEISRPEHIDYYMNPQTLLNLIENTEIRYNLL